MKKFALRHTDIRVQAERVWLDALLAHAPDVRGLVIQIVPYITRLPESRENVHAARLREAGFGTLLVSMLTPYEEARDPDMRYDVSMLGARLSSILTWVDQQPQLSLLPLGLIAIGTTAGAAVRHLAREPHRISALCLRSARPDLAGAEPLRRLKVPTLVQLPTAEPDLRAPNEQAYALMSQVREWQEIEGASANLIEPGSLETAAAAARDWCLAHMPEAPTPDAEPPADAPDLPDAP